MKEDSLIRHQDISIREKKAGVVTEIEKENGSYHINDYTWLGYLNLRIFPFKSFPQIIWAFRNFYFISQTESLNLVNSYRFDAYFFSFKSSH